MKHLFLTDARPGSAYGSRTSKREKAPVAISQRSKIKAVLVNAQWYRRVEEELAHYRK